MRARQVFVVLFVLAGSFVGAVPAAVAVPVTSCDFRAVTDVKLKTDLDCPSTSGITVGADGITIDLNGHRLDGLGNAFYGVVNAQRYSHVTVKDGTVANFAGGVSGSGYAFEVRNVLVTGSTYGITITGTSARVIDSEASDCTGRGIWITGDLARVESSRVFRNGVGIDITGISASVSSSRAAGNKDDGMLIEGSYARVSSSKATGNWGDGIHIVGNHVRVKGSIASGNNDDGVDVFGDAPVIGKTPGGPSSDKNYADQNGFDGAPDGSGQGYWVHDHPTTAPVGRNEASGNDDPAQCNPSTLC